MESRNLPPNPELPKSDNAFKATENFTNTQKFKQSLYSVFRRDRSKTEDNTGFINKQMPAYWHGK